MKEYPSDEELRLFIEELERQELYAPKHMKEQILNRAFPKQTAQGLPTPGGGRDPVQLFSYRLKIIAGMAAALMMLVLLPIQGELQEAQRAVSLLGGRLEGQTEFMLPNSDIYRNLILIKKVKPSPGKYPRKAGLPGKEPL